jgi:mRNA interferase HigB
MGNLAMFPPWEHSVILSTDEMAGENSGDASIIGNNRVVFNIAGNKYRLVLRFDYRRRTGFIRFIGTHAQYDAIDAETI